MEKVLWFDIETTGVDPVKNDIIQIAGIVEIEGSDEEEFSFTCRPHAPDNINPSALEVNRHTIEEISNWEPPFRMLDKLMAVFQKFINKFDRKDKFLPAGHVVTFDIQMLDQFFKKSGDRYGIGSWMTWQPFDTMYLAVILKRLGIINPLDMKLATLANTFGIAPGIHGALSDIRATREVGNHMLGLISASNEPRAHELTSAEKK